MLFILHKGVKIMAELKHDDMKELLVGLTRVETKLDTLGNVKEVAIEAQQSAKSAHMRVDRLDKLVFWLGTTVIGAVIVGAITALFKFGGK
jgi:hypothetical protein